MTKYIKRPADDEDLSLLDFAKTMKVSKDQYTKSRKEAICRIFPRYKLTGIN